MPRSSIVSVSLAIFVAFAVHERTPVAAPATTGTVIGTVSFFKRRKPHATPDGATAYLVPIHRKHGDAPKPVKAVIRQKNLHFSPNQVVIPVGSTVAFPNDDNEVHNVFSPTAPQFDLSHYKTGSRAQMFRDEGEYDIYCDIHAHMQAKVKVVDTDLITPIVDGGFAFRYKLVVWAPGSTEVKEPTPIVVVAGTTITAPRTLHLQLGNPKTRHNRRDGTPYRESYDH